MKYKVILLFFCMIYGNFAFAQSGIVESRNPYRPSAIQSTSMVFRDNNASAFYAQDMLEDAIVELQKKINTNPGQYSFYVPLIDLYIKTKQYDSAFEELVFLYNLSRQNKLSFEVKDDLSKLADKLKRNTKYDKTKSSLYVEIAIISLILEDKESAEKYVLAASGGGVSSNNLKKVLVMVFDTEKNSQSAIQICDNIIARNPDDVEIRKLKALYLTQNQNTDAAISEYNTILIINPQDKESRYNLYKLLKEKNYSEKDFIKKLYPDNSIDFEKIYSELADILMKNSDISGAKYYAQLLTEKYPQNETGYMILAEIYQKEGNLKASYAALEKLRDTADSSEAIAKYNVMMAKMSDEPVREANSLIATGLYQQAIDALSNANQENLYVILTQVRANYLLGNKQEAMELLNKSMSLYPDNSDVYCAFGWLYLQEKEIDTARKYTDGSLKLNPNNKNAKDLLDLVNKAESDTYMKKIVYSYESQNYPEAMKLIDEAISINKKDAVLYFYKALTYIAQNNYAASTAPLYKSIELDKQYAPSYFYLGLAFDNLSEQKNALGYYQQYVNLLKTDDYSETERKEYAQERIKQLNNH